MLVSTSSRIGGSEVGDWRCSCSDSSLRRWCARNLFSAVEREIWGLTEVGRSGEATFAGGSTYEYPVPTGLSTKRTSKCRVQEYGFRSNVRLSVKVYGPN